MKKIQLSLNHKNVSFLKSIMRIVASGALIFMSSRYHVVEIFVAGVFLLTAELLGIYEETV